MIYWPELNCSEMSEQDLDRWYECLDDYPWYGREVDDEWTYQEKADEAAQLKHDIWLEYKRRGIRTF